MKLYVCLAGGLVLLVGAWALRSTTRAGAPPATSHGKEASVQVSVFNSAGQLVTIDSPRIVKTDEQWKRQLTPAQYEIARARGTEPPFCGTLLDNKQEGVYSCVCCGLPLFSSDAKFHSGTGWPSFFQPISESNVVKRQDDSHGMTRTEILCARCDAHLGHVFDDGPRPAGQRFCVNSESLVFTPSSQLSRLADADAPADAVACSLGLADYKSFPDPKDDLHVGPGAGPQTAVLAGGCFWCTEGVFENAPGVLDVVSGYAGGSARTADYKTVSSGATGHAEAIRITYDPAKTSYGKLVKAFFVIAHDPTQRDAQGPDRGHQYRSAIFYANEGQKRVAQAYIKQLTDVKVFNAPIATTIEPLNGFYPAEQYHQDFVRLHPDHPYILQQAIPKIEKAKKAFAEPPADTTSQPAPQSNSQPAHSGDE